MTISSAKELTAFRDAWNSGKYRSAAKAPVLKFKRDISLGTIDGWIPLGTMQMPFDGTVEGGGHRISGTLNCAVPDNVMAAACGLFGHVAATPRSLEGAAIRGLDLDLSVAFQPTSTPQAPSPRERSGGFGTPEWSLSIGALAGRVTRAAIENVRLTDKGAVNFSEASRRPRASNNVEAGGLVGRGEMLTASNLSSAGKVSVQGADDLTAGGLFGTLGQSSLSQSSVSGQLKLAAGNDLTAGGAVGSSAANLSEHPKNAPRLSDITFSGTLEALDGSNAVLGGVIGHGVSRHSTIHLERLRADGKISFALPQNNSRPVRGFTLGGIAGSIRRGEVKNAASSAVIQADIRAAARGPWIPHSIGGLVGTGVQLSLQNGEFSGTVTFINHPSPDDLYNVSGILGHDLRDSRIANVLSQGTFELPQVGAVSLTGERRQPSQGRGLVGLTDQRETFIYCAHWDEKFPAAQGVTWPVKLGEGSSPVPLGEHASASLMNAPIDAAKKGNPQRCLQPGSYQPWKGGPDGRPHIDFNAAAAVLDSAAFGGIASAVPRDAHWNSRIELDSWKPAEVQTHWMRAAEHRELPFPRWGMGGARDEECRPLASALFHLPEDAFCIYGTGAHELGQCSGKRGPRRLRKLRFQLAEKLVNHFDPKKHISPLPLPAGEFFSPRSPFQRLALRAHAFVYTTGVRVESFLGRGQMALGGEEHPTLLAMSQDDAIKLSERTQLFRQIRTPAVRGNPALSNNMKGAPKWVYWNCFDALNPELSDEAAKLLEQHEQKQGSQRPVNPFGLADAENEAEQMKDLYPASLRRVPFCGIGRSGKDVQLPRGIKAADFARQEAFDALEESIESWLVDYGFEARERMQQRYAACPEDDDECMFSKFHALDSIPFGNTKMACSVSDLISTLPQARLIRETWTSPDGEVWTLLAIDQDSFLNMLSQDGSLHEGTVDAAREELARGFRQDAQERMDFLHRVRASEKQAANQTDGTSKDPQAGCLAEAGKLLGWGNDRWCAVMPAIAAIFGPKRPKENEDEYLKEYFNPMLRSQIVMFVRADAMGESIELMPAQQLKEAQKKIPLKLGLAQKSVGNTLNALLPDIEVQGAGEMQVPPHMRAMLDQQTSRPRRPSPAFMFGGLKKADAAKALASISFSEQLKNPAIRFQAPLDDKMKGAPEWVRWTCFEALNGLGPKSSGKQSPAQRYPYCNVTASAAGKQSGAKNGVSPFAANDWHRQAAYSVAEIYAKHLTEQMTGETGTGTAASNDSGNDSLRESDWKTQQDEERRRRDDEFYRQKKLNDMAEALTNELKKTLPLQKTWKDGLGRTWRLEAIDENSLLRAIHRTPDMGVRAEEFIRGLLKNEYKPFEVKGKEEKK